MSEFGKVWLQMYDDLTEHLLDAMNSSLWGGSPEQVQKGREARAAAKCFWNEHVEEGKACRAIEQFARSLRAGLIISYCREKIGDEVVGEPMILQEESQDYEDHSPGDAEYVIVPPQLTDAMIQTLAEHAWPDRYKWGKEKTAFSTWLIKLRLADPLPKKREPRWLVY